MFTLVIETGNDAFAQREEDEVASILRAVADKLDRLGGTRETETGPCMDCNGNKVGSWTLTMHQDYKSI